MVHVDVRNKRKDKVLIKCRTCTIDEVIYYFPGFCPLALGLVYLHLDRPTLKTSKHHKITIVIENSSNDRRSHENLNTMDLKVV